MNDATGKLLHYVYISARSGCEAIQGILPQITDPALLCETTADLSYYCALTARAQQLLRDRSLPAAPFPLSDRLAVRCGVIMETMGTKKQEELARVLRDGCREGADRMRRAVAANSACDREVLALAQRMAAFEATETERLNAWPIRR